ncbi:hypothetical protein NKG94_32685 [Micromonospora sp. M12]
MPTGTTGRRSPGRRAPEYHAWDEATKADGSVTPGKDNQNNYLLFSAGGLDFVAVGLSYGVTPAEAKWADSIFKRYRDRNGIMLSHDYLKPSANPDGRGADFSAPDGSPLFKQVVETNPNVFLVLAGHEHGVGTNLKSKIGVTLSHDVVELLADYQFYTVTAAELWPKQVAPTAPSTSTATALPTTRPPTGCSSARASCACCSSTWTGPRCTSTRTHRSSRTSGRPSTTSARTAASPSRGTTARRTT